MNGPKTFAFVFADAPRDPCFLIVDGLSPDT